MKSMLKGFFCLSLLASIGVVGSAKAKSCDDECSGTETVCPVDCPKEEGNVYGHTFWNPRPVHQNEARKMMGVEDKIHLFGKEEFYGVASLALSYGQTFKSHKIGEFFSFVPNSNRMSYGPNTTSDIFNVEFGTTSTGHICFKPKISNFIADFDLFVGWDEFVCGLWTRIGIPVNVTSFDFNIVDVPTEETTLATANYETGSVTLSTTAVTPVVNATLREGFNGLPFGDVPALKYARVCGKHSQTQVSGLVLDLGYDVLRRERGHLALSLHFVAPTGTKPEAKWLFEPVSGAAHMWELGGTVNTGYQLWENCDGDQRVSVYFDAVVDHEFGSTQKRTFSLLKPSDSSKNAGSQYFILKQFNATKTAVTGLERAANITTTDVKVSCDVMADLGLMLQYDRCNFSFGLGWEFWIRTREKLKCSPTFTALDDGTVFYAVKPDGVDSASSLLTATNASTIGNVITDSTQTFLTVNDIDLCSALHPQAFSNKAFGFVGYNWKDCEWQPYILLGGEVEFGNDNKAANEWFIDLKGGVSF